jgi:hypothetical protein
VTINTECSATLDWSPVTSSQAVSYAIIAQYNGASLGTFPVGNIVTIRTPVLPAGDYLIAVIAYNSTGQGTQGGPTSFIHSCGAGVPSGPPSTAPSWVSLSANGSTVNGSWINSPGENGTEVEATIQTTGQVVSLRYPTGTTTLTVPGVPQGNFLVRLRNFNAFGNGPFSAQRLVVVGVTLGVGDLQVTLTWNQAVDMDLHVIEPDGTHVYYASKTGRTARLDVDNTSGFGPENIYVGPGNAAAGIYQVYIVYYRGTRVTESTISIIINPGTAAQRVALFTRATNSGNPAVGYNVASVDVRNGTITEVTGNRITAAEDVLLKEAAVAAAR